MDPLLTTNELATILTAAVILGLLAGTVAYSWRILAAAMASGGGSQFSRVVRSMGIDLARFSDERALRAAAVSVRRCLNCRHQEACDVWLADPANKGVPPDCPNESFLRELSRQ